MLSDSSSAGGKILSESMRVAWRAVVVMSINFALALAFNPGRRDYAPTDVAVDGAVFAVVTVVIDAFVICAILKKIGSADPPTLPAAAPSPSSSLILLLPKGRGPLIAALCLFFVPLCMTAGFAAFSLSGLASWTFRRFLAYKLTLAALVNEAIVRLILRRRLMPDCWPAGTRGEQ